MESGSTRIRVVPRAGSGWELRETADGPVLSSTATKHEAVARAFVMLEQGRGGELVVARADGSVERRVDVRPGPPRPWWYVRPGLLRWLVLFLLASQVLLRLLGGRTVLDLVATGGLLVLFMVAVVVVLLSRASDRSRGMSDLD